MDYKKHYNLLMDRSRGRKLEGYVEKHHIVPKCLNGSDDESNLAILTPEEHFLAHQLLVKMYPKCQPLINAAVIMTTHHTNSRANNKLFGWLRRKASEYRKQWLIENGHPKGMLGKKHKGSGLSKVLAAQALIVETKKVKIYAYNLDGTFYKEYSSITECADDLQTSPSNVKYTADGDFNHCRKKQLKYEYTDCVKPYISPFAGIKKQQYVCPFCKKLGAGPAMKRFHFNNCKLQKEKP
jgi:hypothetical protein